MSRKGRELLKALDALLLSADSLTAESQQDCDFSTVAHTGRVIQAEDTKVQ